MHFINDLNPYYDPQPIHVIANLIIHVHDVIQNAHVVSCPPMLDTFS